jgi:hypothetical protein
MRGLGEIGCLGGRPISTPTPIFAQARSTNRDLALAHWLAGIAGQLHANLSGLRADDAMTLMLCRRNLRTILNHLDARAGGGAS